MTERILRLIFIISLGATASPALSLVAAEAAPPPKRNLVLHGGGPGAVPAIEQFVKLAGGADARLLVVPTAAGSASYENFDHIVIRRFRAFGATKIRVLHARTRAEADSEDFVREIDSATGIWFTGGRQWRLADTYVGTEAEAAMRRLLARGGVVGGGSAGATIQGSYLVRGDTRGANLVSGDHEQGFGFLPGVAIDQHVLVRNRHFDLLELIRRRPDLMGLGIDENTAVIVSGDDLEVIGEGYVAVYDPKLIVKSGRFYFLRSGDRLSIRTRVPYRPGEGGELWIPHVLPELTLDAERRSAYCGRYSAGDFSLDVVDRDGLAIQTPDRELIPIRAVSPDAFYELYTGEKVTFSVGVDGCVTRVRWHSGAAWLELDKTTAPKCATSAKSPPN
jgi:cyanophycinase